VARPKAFVFDAYGTLFDVHSVVEAGRAVTGDPQALSTLWRQKQLEYTWLRALMGRYEDFWAVTEAALRWTLGRLGIRAGETEIARLMEAYLSLATFPEVSGALAAMAGAKAFGYRVCWCNRLGAPRENLGITPDLEVPRLDEILPRLG
jgi:2-haloacid dehalogenase